MSQVISQLPRFALEAIAFGGMLLLVLYLMAQSGSFSSAHPSLHSMPLPAIACCPPCNRSMARSRNRYAGPALEALHKDLFSLQPAIPNSQHPAMPLADHYPEQHRLPLPQHRHPGIERHQPQYWRQKHRRAGGRHRLR